MDHAQVESAEQALWASAWTTQWKAYYQVCEGELLIARWKMIHLAISLLIAVTASGSAVAGFALWNRPGWSYLWALLVLLASLAAIVSSTIGVPDRLREQEQSHREFTKVYVGLEGLLMDYRMKKPLADMQSQFAELRKQYALAMANQVISDYVLTDGLRQQAYERANREFGEPTNEPES